jgi:hypothetical protein
LVVKPYTVLEKDNTLKSLENYSTIKSKIEGIEHEDRICYLVFIKGQKAIGYGSVSRGQIDFATFPGAGVLLRENCDKVFTKGEKIIITK